MMEEPIIHLYVKNCCHYNILPSEGKERRLAFEVLERTVQIWECPDNRSYYVNEETGDVVCDILRSRGLQNRLNGAWITNEVVENWVEVVDEWAHLTSEPEEAWD